MQDWREIKEVFIRCVRVTLFGAGAAGLALFLCADVISEQVFSTPNLAGVLRWMVLGVVPLALLTLHAQGLQGMRKFREALLVLNVAVPLMSLPLLFLMVPSFGVIGAVWAYVIATVGTLAIGIWRWRSAVPRESSIRSESRPSELFASSIPLFWTSVFQLTILWVPIVLLGTWATMKDVGLYSAATRVVVLITMIVMSVNSVLSPTFSSLFRLGDIVALRRVTRLSATLTTVAVAPIIAFVVVWPSALMSVFGNEFSDGGTLLVILAMGQFFNVLTGSVGHLLMMCGHEHFVRNNVIGCALLNLGCCVLLIPRYGATGAATAVAITVIAENVSAAIYAWFKLGVLSVPAIGSR
jgi:O-antigen/teichoic acid export membrane protein